MKKGELYQNWVGTKFNKKTGDFYTKQEVEQFLKDRAIKQKETKFERIKEKGSYLNGASREAYRVKINPDTGILYTDEEITNKLKNKSRKGVDKRKEKEASGFRYINGSSIESFLNKVNPLTGNLYTYVEAKEWFHNKSKKSNNTLTKSGYYDNPANNTYSKAYWLSKGLTQEEAQKKVNERNNRKKEYWIKRGYSEVESIQKAKDSANMFSKSGWMERGLTEDEAKLKIEEVRENISRRSKLTYKSVIRGSNKSSKSANKLFLKIYKFLRKKGLERNDFYLELNQGEFYIKEKGGPIYFYDFVVPKINLVIEYNGEHCHPDKETMTSEHWSKWKHAFNKKSADEIYQIDLHKKRNYNEKV